MERADFPTKNPYMGVSKNRGTPKWMVKIMVPNPIKMDDLGVPLFLETPISWSFCHVCCLFTCRKCLDCLEVNLGIREVVGQKVGILATDKHIICAIGSINYHDISI